MVPSRRPGVHHRGLGHGAGHDTGSRLPLFRSCTKKIGTEHDMGVHGFVLGHNVSMVPLGILAWVQQLRNKWIHWRFEEVWLDEYTGSTSAGDSTHPGPAICILSGMGVAGYMNGSVNADKYRCNSVRQLPLSLWVLSLKEAV